ncbi:Crp/Fnr family transcriptional regulator [Methylobacterium gossipiicola]|uniref:cAMP-binding domain of CRP or a regulatory subunit of cAMP-dependent protein kinases n=1 Tax=Methylobacterium gossipiicola TaxID=582675 RepID=A0A1I2WE41_9HYPH|nr:Crp/Fnr family transcriptional regulator [Methylobacterium gossipiicola]SFG99603.1 cAMP-binding domain of CRP or a regulatory subunit of cAMP-dependent protein kinases [Methylobacterium gossipiicola]
MLPPEEFSRLQPELERCSFEQGLVLEAPDTPIAKVCFPEPGLISVMARTPVGVQAEVGIIGPEGMTGLPLLHGLTNWPHATVVQIPCRALCIEATAFRAALAECRPLHDRLLRYAQVFAVQLAQGSLCNGRFTIEQRLARWLLMCHDRTDREDLPLTHELLSSMLGVRRAGITTALRTLNDSGAVRSRRGGIGIRDRAQMRAIAGDAYGVPEAEYARVLA